MFFWGGVLNPSQPSAMSAGRELQATREAVQRAEGGVRRDQVAIVVQQVHRPHRRVGQGCLVPVRLWTESVLLVGRPAA